MRGMDMAWRRALAAVVLAAAMTVAACGEKKEETPAASSGSGTEETAQKDCGKVTLNEQAWAGSTANTYIASVQKVTAADVQAFASKRLAAANASIVVVGNASQFLDALKKQFPNVEVVPAAELDLNSASLRKAMASK